MKKPNYREDRVYLGLQEAVASEKPVSENNGIFELFGDEAGG